MVPRHSFALRRYAAILAILATAATPSHAFEPLTTLAVSVGTSLIVKGFNFLVNRATAPPDLHFEETKAMHRELRAVHQAVLENRSLLIDLDRRRREDIERVIEEMLDMEQRIKKHTIMGFENERVVRVLAHVAPVYDTVNALSLADSQERNALKLTLQRQFDNLQPEVESLNYVENIRAGTIPTRLAAIRAGWTALSNLPLPQRRRTYVAKEGDWLNGQRYSSGSDDALDQTLADLILTVEEKAHALDSFFASLDQECSGAWSGLLSIDQYTRKSPTEIAVSHVRLTKVRRDPVALESVSDLEEERPYNLDLIRPMNIQFVEEVVKLEPTVRVRIDDADLDFTIAQLHRDAFGCPLSQPPRVAGVPDLSYLRGMRSNDLTRLRPCADETACSQFWEYLHMTREIASGTLTGLYAIRQELNRTLEWLAYETTGAECTFLYGQPRVCVFGQGIDEAAADGNDEVVAKRTERDADGPSLKGAFRWSRDIRDAIDQEALGRARFELGQTKLENVRMVEAMNRDLSHAVERWRDRMDQNDALLEEAARQAVRASYQRFFWSVVEDQVTDWLSSNTTEILEDLLQSSDDPNGDSEPDYPPDWLVVSTVDGSPHDDGADGDLVLAMINPASLIEDAVLSGGDAVRGFPDDSPPVGNAFTEEIGASLYGFDGDRGHPSWPQRLALWLPPVPKSVEELVVGYGESVSLGMVRRVNEWFGTTAELDRSTGLYKGGSIAGVLTVGGVGGAVLRAGRAGRYLAKFGTPTRFSLFVRLTPRSSSTISLIKHKGFLKGRIAAADVNVLGSGPLATRLPHFHLAGVRAHLPWEPPWLVPAVAGFHVPKAE